MAIFDTTGEVIIHRGNAHEFVSPVVDGEKKSHGLIPRNYTRHPVGSYPWATAVDFPLIPKSEYADRIREGETQKSFLSHIRMTGNNGAMIPSRDQNGRGYCWRHSPTSAQLLIRAIYGEPYADLSAYAGACRIKNYRDEGGWGAQGVDDAITFGDPTSEFWPQRATSSKYDTPATWANAKKHTILAQWADTTAAQYDRNLSFEQNCTLLLSRCPCVVDFNWWSHSICGMDVVNGNGQRRRTRSASGKLVSIRIFEDVWGINDPVTAGFGIRIWNSWGDSWSQQGTGILTGSQAVPDGSVGPRLASLAA